MLKRLPQLGSVFAPSAVWCSRWSTSVSGPVFATTSRPGTGSVEIRCWAARPPASVGNLAPPRADARHAGAEIFRFLGFSLYLKSRPHWRLASPCVLRGYSLRFLLKPESSHQTCHPRACPRIPANRSLRSLLIDAWSDKPDHDNQVH